MKNLLDRVIDYVSPIRGLQRERARRASAIVSLAYEGAKTGRRTDSWVTGSASANAEIGPAIVRLRSRWRGR